MKAVLAILAVVVLSSCAVQQPSRTYVASYRLPNGTTVIKSVTLRP